MIEAEAMGSRIRRGWTLRHLTALRAIDGGKEEEELSVARNTALHELRGIAGRLQAWRNYMDGRLQEGESSVARVPGETLREGWQGSSTETFEMLLQHIAQEFNQRQFRSEVELKDFIHRCSVTVEQMLDVDPGISQKDYKKNFQNISYPANMAPRWQEGGRGFLRFKKTETIDANILRKHSSRFALNTQPRHVECVIKDLLPKIAPLNEIIQVKVMAQLRKAAERADILSSTFMNYLEAQLNKIWETFSAKIMPHILGEAIQR